MLKMKIGHWQDVYCNGASVYNSANIQNLHIWTEIFLLPQIEIMGCIDIAYI